MTTYVKHISEPYFSLIKSGRKTIEGRLYLDIWKSIKIGDNIIWWTGNKESGYSEISLQFKCSIIDKYLFDSFSDLYLRFGHKLLPDVSSLQQALNVYIKDENNPDGLFDKHQEAEVGVVGIEMRLVN